MAADRGLDNPLKTAIEQTPGLTIVRTLPIYRPPYFKLAVANPAEVTERGIAFAPGDTFFVGLDPRSYDVDLQNQAVVEIFNKLGKGAQAIHPSNREVGDSMRFGGVRLKENLPSFESLKDGAFNIEDPDLKKALEEAQRQPGARTYRAGIVFDTTRTSYGAIFPSIEVATLAADLHEFSLAHTGPYPLHSFPFSTDGAMDSLGGKDVQRLAAVSDELPIIQEIGSRYIPGYTPQVPQTT